MKRLLPLITHPALAPFFLRLSLTIHNKAYQMAGMLSAALEPDGLHPKHRLMNYHAWFASRLEKDWDVLDVGCGNGSLAFDIKSVCRSVTGVDISQKNIDRARERFSREGITFICADALTHRFEGGYHAIILSNVLEHIEHRVAFLKRIVANQNTGQPPILLIRVPMINRDWITLYKKERGVEWRLDDTHFTEYTLDQLVTELDHAGLVMGSHEIMFGECYGVVKKR